MLLDELGAGTDPQEGAALARAILSDMVERRIPCLVATHYPELKIYAHDTPGIINASMEFDLHTLRPTYHLTLGLPGRSNALAIASRLGLEKKIIDGARTRSPPKSCAPKTCSMRSARSATAPPASARSSRRCVPGSTPRPGSWQTA